VGLARWHAREYEEAAPLRRAAWLEVVGQARRRAIEGLHPASNRARLDTRIDDRSLSHCRPRPPENQDGVATTPMREPS
jgi:hypothetical protein